MGDDLYICMESCSSTSSRSARVGNGSYDLECIAQCSQRHVAVYRNTTEKYTRIIQIIGVVLITFGLIGKVFNCIIFLRKSLSDTSTGLLLLLKTLFDIVLLLWTFIFYTKFFVDDEQINTSRLICVLTRCSDIFVSWSIGFVILACTVHLVTIVHSKHLPQPTRLRIFELILLMMSCGLIYNWHVFYYPNLVTTTLPGEKKLPFTYCNILFGRQMGYLSFGGFRATQEFLYNAPIVNFIVSSLIPFIIVATINIIIIVYVLKTPSPKRISRISLEHNDTLLSKDVQPLRSSFENLATEKTKKDVSYETTIILITSCVFLTTNSIASIYLYVKTSHRLNRSRLIEDLKTSNVYRILCMLTLFGTILEFYIYFLIGKKFRQEVYQIINAILKHTPLRKCFKSTSLSSTIQTTNVSSERQQTIDNNQNTLTQSTMAVGTGIDSA